jgi:hypothetical protein
MAGERIENIADSATACGTIACDVLKEFWAAPPTGSAQAARLDFW